MSDSSSSSPSGRVAALAESFLERYRKGERPALAEYTDRYPELADEIRAGLPGHGRDGAARPAARCGRAHRPVRRRRAGRRPGDPSDRRLPGPPRDRPGRHGRGLRGRAGLAGPARGAEGPAGPRAARRQAARAVPPRGAGGGAAAPHQHRAGLRRGRARGDALLRHAVHPGAGAWTRSWASSAGSVARGPRPRRSAPIPVRRRAARTVPPRPPRWPRHC